MAVIFCLPVKHVNVLWTLLLFLASVYFGLYNFRLQLQGLPPSFGQVKTPATHSGFIPHALQHAAFVLASKVV